MATLAQHDPSTYNAIKADPTGAVGMATILHDRQMESKLLAAPAGSDPLADNFDVFQYANRRGLIPPTPGALAVGTAAVGDLWNGAKGIADAASFALVKPIALSAQDDATAAEADRDADAMVAAGAKNAVGAGAQLAAGAAVILDNMSVKLGTMIGDLTPAQAQLEKDRASWTLYQVNSGIAASQQKTMANLKAITGLDPDMLENSVNGLGQVMNPANLIPAGEAFTAVSDAGKSMIGSVFKLTDRSLPGVTEGLAVTLRKAASAHEMANIAFDSVAYHPGVDPAIVDSATQLVKDTASDLEAATSAHASSVAADEAAQAKALQAGFAARATGKLAAATGTALQLPAKAVDAGNNLISGALDKVAPGNASAQKMIRLGVGAAAGAAYSAIAPGDDHNWFEDSLVGALGVEGLRIGGQDLNALGRQLMLGQVASPYFRRVAADAAASGATRWVAANVLDPLTPFAAPFLDAAAAGITGVAHAAPIGAALGFVQSGGDPSQALSGAAGIAPLGFVAGLGGALTPSYQEHQAALTGEANRQYYMTRIANDPVSTANFANLSLESQTLLSNWAHSNPDFTLLDLRNQAQQDFIGSPAGAGVPAPTGGGVTFKGADGHVYVALDPSDPKAFSAAITGHEIRHAMQMTDPALSQAVQDTLVGNVENGVPGIYSQKDAQGNPVVVTDRDALGNPTKRYATTPEFQALKKNYQDRVTAASGVPYSISDADFALEHDAEESAQTWAQTDSFGHSARPTISGILASKLQDAPFLRTLLGKLGASFTLDGEISGTSKAFTGIRATPETQKLVQAYTDAWAARDPNGPQPEPPKVDLSLAAIQKNPGLLELLKDSSEVNRNPATGKPVGVIQDPVTGKDVISDPSKLFKKASEINSDNQKMADAVAKAVADSAAANPASGDPDSVQPRTQNDGSKVIAGRYFTDDHMKRIADSGAFDPSQLNKLQLLNGLLKTGKSTFTRAFYQPATKFSGKYASRSGHWVEEIPTGFKVTAADNITIQSFAPDKLARNLEKLWQTGKGPARSLWPTTAGMLADTMTYLADLGSGRPGATTVGEAKRDAINAALGLKGADRGKANPVYETTPQKSLTPAIVSRRLDRTNRLSAGLRADAPQFNARTYEAAKANFTPPEN